MGGTPQTLAQMIRSKYPNAYNDLDDVTLEKNVLAKYPQYGDLPRTQEGTFGGRFLESSGLSGVVQAVKHPIQTAGDLASTALAPATQAAQTAIAPMQHLSDVISKYKAGDKEGALSSVGKLIDSFVPGTGNAQQVTQDTLKDIQQHNVGAVAGTAAGLGTQLALGATSKIPSAARAGEALQEIKGVAGDVPIDMARPGNTALELYEQSQRGATLPKVVRDFVKRATDPKGDPITYAEAKDFQSNVSALSADEKMSLKPNTKRLLGQLNSDLKSSLEDAADVQGKGEQFQQAMKEYHHAMQLRNLSEAAKDALWKAVLTGAGIYGLKKIWESAAP